MKIYYFDPNKLEEAIGVSDVNNLTNIVREVYASPNKQNVIDAYIMHIENKIERNEAEIEHYRKFIKMYGKDEMRADHESD